MPCNTLSDSSGKPSYVILLKFDKGREDVPLVDDLVFIMCKPIVGAMRLFLHSNSMTHKEHIYIFNINTIIN